MIKVIIFDFGGVVRKPRIMPEIYKATEKKFKIDYEFVRNQFLKLETPVITGKLSMNKFWSKLAKALDVNVKELKQLWERIYVKKFKLNTRVMNLVKRLKKRYKIVLLSNDLPSHSKINLKRGDYKIFDKVFLSSKIGLRKPDKRVYLYVLRKLKVKPEECVFIDDREENVAAAKKLGINTIQFKNVRSVEKELKKYL